MTACIVRKIALVKDHPDTTRPDLSVITTSEGLTFVSQKTPDSSGALTIHRYEIGALVAHLPHGAVLSEELQARLDAPPKIKAGNWRSVRSEGMLLPADEAKPGATEGEDVTDELGIVFR